MQFEIDVTLGVVGASVLVSWGVTKATIKFNEKRLTDMFNKLDELTRKMSYFMCTDNCEKLRNTCRDEFKDIKKRMTNNKDLVTSQFGEIKVFIGRVEEYMRSHNGSKG